MKLKLAAKLSIRAKKNYKGSIYQTNWNVCAHFIKNISLKIRGLMALQTVIDG